MPTLRVQGIDKYSLYEDKYSRKTDKRSLKTDAHSLGNSKRARGIAKKPWRSRGSANKTDDQWMIHIRKFIGDEQIKDAFRPKGETRINKMLRANGASGINTRKYKHLKECFGLGLSASQ